MEENIKLSDLLGVCLDLTEDPTPEHEAAFKDLLSKLAVKSYMPLQQKEITLIVILNNCTTKDLDPVTTEMNLTIAKVIYGVLGYVVNLDNDLEFAAFDIGAIDMLYSLGIIDDILKFCAADYNRLEHMLNDVMNFSNLVRLSELATLMAPENIDSFVQTVKDLKTELTPERLDELKSLATSGSPEWAALKETVTEEVLSRVMDRDFRTLSADQNMTRKVIRRKASTLQESGIEKDIMEDLDKPEA